MRFGIVGWRGMVGSVLVARMRAERDFTVGTPAFFSTTKAGQRAPDIGVAAPPVGDANDTAALGKMDVIIS